MVSHGINGVPVCNAAGQGYSAHQAAAAAGLARPNSRGWSIQEGAAPQQGSGILVSDY